MKKTLSIGSLLKFLQWDEFYFDMMFFFSFCTNSLIVISLLTNVTIFYYFFFKVEMIDNEKITSDDINDVLNQWKSFDMDARRLSLDK